LFSFFEEKLNSNQNCAQRPYFVQNYFACGGLTMQNKQKSLASAKAFSCDKIKIKKTKTSIISSQNIQISIFSSSLDPKDPISYFFYVNFG
jgi:hypothetical protein